MNVEHKNPFSRIRAEQMGDSAWKYFVEPSKDYVGNKPLIFEGSRGTGKTMFFKCNSWKEKIQESKSQGLTTHDFFIKNKHVGFYYKVDGRFVKSLDKKRVEISLWEGIFNTYFNIIITKEIIQFVHFLNDENLLRLDLIDAALTKISMRLKKNKASSIAELETQFDEVLISIEQFSNNTNEPIPVGLNAGTIIEEMLLLLKINDLLCSTTFHVFVDEYENLASNQQVLINTLLKQSNSDIVYDFGVITKGITDYKTSSGQEIRPKDDFFLYSTDRYGYYESLEYNNLLKEICRKRLKIELERQGQSFSENYTDISYYLKNYGKRYEEEKFSKSNGIDKIKDRVLEEIEKQSKIFNYTEEEIKVFYEELTNCSIINMRMHVALLLRRNKNMIPAKKLVEHKQKSSKIYADWIHNTESAVIYLLCHELKVDKTYHGFNVYSALSSGVIRSFLELTEIAFDFALNNPKEKFSFESPRPFTADEQTKAVYFISKNKIKEIDSYEPYGFRLKDFTIALGHVFKSLQTNPNATLGEVEQNHFQTNTNELVKNYKEANNLLKYCVRHKILEEDDPTKTKSEELVEFVDYHINHIYCPAFRISHLRKRKIPISHTDLAKLFCGSNKELQDVVKKLSGSTQDNLPNLFS